VFLKKVRTYNYDSYKQHIAMHACMHACIPHRRSNFMSLLYEEEEETVEKTTAAWTRREFRYEFLLLIFLQYCFALLLSDL
jgi:hypothetical protein